MNFPEIPKFHLKNKNYLDFQQTFCKTQEHEKSIKQDIYVCEAAGPSANPLTKNIRAHKGKSTVKISHAM